MPVDVVFWYTAATFDAIGDLVFGGSFHCVEKSEIHVRRGDFTCPISNDKADLDSSRGCKHSSIMSRE